MKPRLPLAAALLLACGGLSAAEIEFVEVTHSRGEYHVVISARLAAPPDRVHAVLSDYPRWPEINDLIKESEVEQADAPDRHLVRTVTGGCIAFFCKHFEQVQWISTAPGRIDADVIPERSELKHGWARTRLAPSGDGTHFHYEMALAPRFWIPPVIGPLLIQLKLRKQAVETAEIVERIAADSA